MLPKHTNIKIASLVKLVFDHWSNYTVSSQSYSSRIKTANP